MVSSIEHKISESALDELLSVLRSLDRLLERAVSQAELLYGSDATADPYRGLYIDSKDVERALEQELDNSELLETDDDLELFFSEISNGWRFKRLQEIFELSAFDLGLVAIALAPEINLRYERIYAYLQDDVTRKRPSVNLALNLLCSSATEKFSRWVHLTPNAPLIRQGLLQLIPDSNQPQSPLLAYYLKLDEQITRWLLGQEELDARLRQFSQLLLPTISLESLPLEITVKQALGTLSVQTWQTQESLRFYFQGLPGMGKQRTAEAIAFQLGVPLLTADLGAAVQQKQDIEAMLRLLLREARLHNAIAYLSGVDALLNDDQYGMYWQLLATLTENKGIAILAGRQALSADKIQRMNAIAVEFSLPNFAQRRTHWQANLAKIGIALNDEQIDDLSDRFRLTPEQIEGAIATACNRSRWAKASESENLPVDVQPTLLALFAAARMQSGQDLTTLARKVSPKHTWDEIILPSDRLRQLREMCNQLKYRHIVFNQWGFEQTLSLGKGINALFSGTPGTGKTMAAEVIANDLELDLYKIDLSQIVSKYIGETEKNLDRVFTMAANANAILLFDEADALFGKRSDVKDAHDRYANLEIAYLLQKMEEYEGITILTTNLRQNLDEAFTRRVRFIIEFPFPEAEHRLSIWQGIFPKPMPLATDVDLMLMAKQFKLAGGNIRNIAVAAAFLAAEDGEGVGMKHLLQATKREFQKMGRLVNEADFFKLGTG